VTLRQIVGEILNELPIVAGSTSGLLFLFLPIYSMILGIVGSILGLFFGVLAWAVWRGDE